MGIGNVLGNRARAIQAPHFQLFSRVSSDILHRSSVQRGVRIAKLSGAAAEDFARSNYVNIDYSTQQRPDRSRFRGVSDPTQTWGRVVFCAPTQDRVRALLLLHPMSISTLCSVESAPSRTSRPITSKRGGKNLAGLRLRKNSTYGIHEQAPRVIFNSIIQKARLELVFTVQSESLLWSSLTPKLFMPRCYEDV